MNHHFTKIFNTTHSVCRPQAHLSDFDKTREL